MNFFYRTISSLYKIREPADIPQDALTAQRLLRGEHFAFQLVMFADVWAACRVSARVADASGATVSCATEALQQFRVQNVVMDFPMYEDHDDDIITDRPGLMPDLLTPMSDTKGLVRMGKAPVSVLFSLDTPTDILPGSYSVEITMDVFETSAPGQVTTFNSSVKLDILSEAVREQSVSFTQWFHVDSIAEAYGVPVYSEEHWALIDKYMSAARYVGIDTILTPIFTPPLDTLIGGERPKVQLVRIEKKGGSYGFDFSLADRYIALAKKNGIERFEISHMFSQWGLVSAPNIYGWENGEEKKMFGWDTDAHGEEYKAFLTQFIPALVAFLKEAGVYQNCFFHLSDEPQAEHLENYRKAHDLVKPFIPDRPIMDALSDIEFYRNGLTDIPITVTDQIEPFLKEDIPQQWAYYCWVEYKKVGNRFLAFPAYRNRILGIQLFKFNIKGFLQWGFNFYHSERSMYYVDPYTTTSSDKAFPSGDPFSVYPGKNGPLLTLRALIFKDALQDVEILKALERRTSHQHVVELIEKYAGMDIRFDEYPRNYVFIPQVMEAVKQELAE